MIVWRRIAVVLLALACAFGCSGEPQAVTLQVGSDVSSAVHSRIAKHLSAAGAAVNEVVAHPSQPIDYCSLPPGSLVLATGNTSSTAAALSDLRLSWSALLAEAGSDGFFLATTSLCGVATVVGDGNRNAEDPFDLSANLGVHYAAYAALEALGFAFLHPLDPVVPIAPLKPHATLLPPGNATVQSPYWPFRGWHYHTEHPLDLHEFLNGFPSVDASWEEMLPEAEMFFEWLVANRQNRLEYILLWTRTWDEFAWSDLRKQRLSTIVDMAHEFGIAIAADVPIAEKQQHAWYMTGGRGTLQQQTEDIHRHVDWIFDAGFNFIATESGYSEFTKPDCSKMLQWMNILTEYVMESFKNKRVFIKCHCSTGQVCDDYVDPATGKPVNFNFLPAFADERLGVFPHTVQYYNLTEPTGLTYGNVNFTYMYEFIETETPLRDVVYHGESAYWVNYDINVPLFLPIYARGRLDDLRMLAQTGERDPSHRVLGQMNFESGWEWAYWLQNVVTARAAFNPQLQASKGDQALRAALMDVTRIFGEVAESVTDILMAVIDAQTELLVHGMHGDVRPADVTKRNGMAYLQGWDTWTEFEQVAVPDTCTQPHALGINQVRARLDRGVSYEKEVQPLLAAMEKQFDTLLIQFTALEHQIPSPAQRFYAEIVDAMNVTAVRASQVFAAYDYAWSVGRKAPRWRAQRLQESADGITSATEIIQRREKEYRSSVERIASWRPNPTCYHYTFLWTAHSQYYFWRDYQKAANVSATTLTPCFMNYNDPAETGFGPGVITNVSHAIGEWLEEHDRINLSECLLLPESEPTYPSVVVPNFPPPESVMAGGEHTRRQRVPFGL